jgi:poly-gamma-glutamate synthesis protein (capsule biosynthesis protein)
MLKRFIFSNLLLLSFITIKAQDSLSLSTMSLLFIGDIMGHDSQINAAYDVSSKSYNYDEVFAKVSPIFKKHDFAIANLEVTLAGKPFKGYPQFSSPDELAVATKNSGINTLLTANNHSCDRGKQGIVRTIKVLDSLGINHTGTFLNSNERESLNLLILSKNEIRVGILNYTYGTNGLSVPSPTIVNRIDKIQMASDIEKSKAANLDKLIVVMHWGKEYSSYASSSQIDITHFLFDKGVDIIIGSHPHVIQPMEYYEKTKDHPEQLVAFSLGNFISNQRKRKTDGGAMVGITLTKQRDETRISNSGYYLIWVNKPIVNGVKKFEVVPCAEYESINFPSIDVESINKMKLFMKDSRILLNTENIYMPELGRGN